MSEAATNGASPNLYEVIGRIVVILAAMWILWQLLCDFPLNRKN